MFQGPVPLHACSGAGPPDLGGARLRASGFGFRDEGLGWVKMGLGFRVTVVGFRGLRLTG